MMRSRSGDSRQPTRRRGKRRVAAIALLSCLASLVVIDTGPATAATIDGQFDMIGPIGQGSTTNLTVVGRGGVPATGVGAVALNVTATNPTSNSYLTVWPTGSAQPLASNLNFSVGQTVPNMVIVPVGVNGQISIYNNAGGVDVIVDVLGWFPTADSYTGLTPARLMDTRPAAPTIDGLFAATGPIGGPGTNNLTVLVAAEPFAQAVARVAQGVAKHADGAAVGRQRALEGRAVDLLRPTGDRLHLIEMRRHRRPRDPWPRASIPRSRLP